MTYRHWNAYQTRILTNKFDFTQSLMLLTNKNNAMISKFKSSNHQDWKMCKRQEMMVQSFQWEIWEIHSWHMKWPWTHVIHAT